MFTAHVSLLVVGLLVLTPVLPVSLPPYIKACKRNDPELSKCTLEHGMEAIPKFVKGDRTLGIPVLDPFYIEEIIVNESKERNGVNLGLKFKNLTVTGFRHLRLNNGTSVDLQKRKVVFKGTVPLLELKGLYSINGRILLLPIKGDGGVNMTLGHVDLTFKVDYVLRKGVGGKEFIHMVKRSLDFTAKNFKIHLSNLFNGDKLLGDNMNTLLNENSAEVLSEFSPVIKQTVGELVFFVYNRVTSKIPYDDIFPK